MGLYIPNMEMPKSCMDCSLNGENMRCLASGKSTIWASDYVSYQDKGIDLCEERLPDCPLICLPDEFVTGGGVL